AAIERFDLDARPLTKALLLRSADLVQESLTDIKRMGLKPRMAPPPTELDEMIAEAVRVVASDVSNQCIAHLGRSAEFLPHQPLPKDAPAMMAFTLFVVTTLSVIVRQEGCKLELNAFFNGLGVS